MGTPRQFSKMLHCVDNRRKWQRTLINCTTANEMWERLKSQHEQTTGENKHVWQQKFYEYCYQPNHSVLEHITEIEYLGNQLNDFGAHSTEMQIITTITSTLPRSFKSVISAWNMIDDDKKTIALLASRLIAEETLNKSHGDTDESDEAFFVKKGFRQSMQSKRGGCNPAKW